MEEKEPEHIPDPGLAEAIHPEIGNGFLWEKDTNSAILRNPDPTKELDARLTDPDTRVKIIKSWSEGEKTSDVFHTNLPVPLSTEDNWLPQPEEQSNAPEKTENKIATPGREPGILPEEIKPKAKKALKKSRKAIENDVTPDIPETYPEKESSKRKVPKAGKLVRKAAKTVQKQEEKGEEKRQEAGQIMTHSDPNLSPFTQWLKSLRGSDYVHPYDDDFAIHQGAWPVKEGISETFADLLAAQGYKEQAIEMYMRLMEKYPEKSGFFAAKIEALQ